MEVCEMIHTSPGPDGLGHQWQCAREAVATTEDGVRCCAGCAEGMRVDGLSVTYDAGREAR